MTKMIRPTALLALLLCATTAQAQTPERLVFVGCPILRNTKPVPCWMGEAAGQLYYLGPQGDLQAAFYPPQFNHQMLVEATIDKGQTFCGGIVLKNVHASVLPQIDQTCNVTLPAQGYEEHSDVRGSGPSGVRDAPPPPPLPRPAPPEAPKPPFAARTYAVPFDADATRLWREAQTAITAAARYAAAAKASSIEVVGYRAAIRLSNGKDYVERKDLDQDRASVVATALKTLGLPDGVKLIVRWENKPLAGTGTAKDAENRRVIIVVKP